MSIKIDKNKIYLFAGIALVVVILVVIICLCGSMMARISESRVLKDRYNVETTFMGKILTAAAPEKIAPDLVAKSRFSEIVDALILLGKAHNVDFVSLRPGREKDTKAVTHDQMFFNMEAVSTLKDLGEFLAEVRTSPLGVLDIDSMVLTEVRNEQGRIKASIVLTLLAAKGNEK